MIKIHTDPLPFFPEDPEENWDVADDEEGVGDDYDERDFGSGNGGEFGEIEGSISDADSDKSDECSSNDDDDDEDSAKKATSKKPSIPYKNELSHVKVAIHSGR